MPVFLVMYSVAATAQTISYFGLDRNMSNIVVSLDSITGTYSNAYPGFPNGSLGVINTNDTQITPAAQQYIHTTNLVTQDSTIIATPTSLTVTGQLQVAVYSSAFGAGGQGGLADWWIYSRLNLGFSIDQPFMYSLQATTSLTTNIYEAYPDAFVSLGHGNQFDVAAYGNSVYLNHTAPTNAGTSTGVLSPGTYSFHALAICVSGIDQDHSPAIESRLVSFSLTVAPMLPPQPPAIVSFAPSGTDAFDLVWNADAAGNYRVTSSTNLLDWSEYSPPTAQPAGLNTNVINVISGSDQGYYRIELMP